MEQPYSTHIDIEAVSALSDAQIAEMPAGELDATSYALKHYMLTVEQKQVALEGELKRLSELQDSLAALLEKFAPRATPVRSFINFNRTAALPENLLVSKKQE